jgi:precorrin-6B methylase 2
VFRNDTSVNEVFRNEVPPQVVVPTPVVKNDISLDLVPTPHDAIPILVDLLRPTPSDIFIEPGCGDGRVLKAVSKFCPSIGIELNQNTAELAQRNLGNDALVLHEDATQADYTRATIVSMYLYPDVMDKLVPLLQPGTRVVSYCHSIPGIKCKEYTVNGHTFYIGVK